MAGLEMVQPLEGMGTPLKVRSHLRQMFERWLSRSHHPCSPLVADEIVDELSILDLCEHYRLEYPGGAHDVAKNWDESAQRMADGGPTFDDLVRLGWVFFDGGRWIMQRVPLGTSSHVTYPSPSTKTFLEGLGNARLVAETDTPPPDAQALAARILAESWLDRHIPTKCPGWIAGRLWERLGPKPRSYAADKSGNAMRAATSVEDGICDSSASLDPEAEVANLQPRQRYGR